MVDQWVGKMVDQWVGKMVAMRAVLLVERLA
jgi:hypothetical protein